MFNKDKHYFILFLLIKYLWMFNMSDLSIESQSTEKSYTFSCKDTSLQSQNIVAQPFFSLKNMLIGSVWKLFEIACCLVHLPGLKLKKPTLRPGEGRFLPQFLWVIVRKSNIILIGIYLSRCFQTILNKLTNKLHIFHTASTGSPNLKSGVIFWFYILALSYNA